jgi:protein required for attachment to host cells
MEIGGTTWIVAADGTQARVFEERSRAGDVRELSERAVHALESDTPRAHRHGATVHDRHGPGRHGAGERALGDEVARRFLERLAHQLNVAARDGDFDSLVLMAPPRALGLLKLAMVPMLRDRVTATDPHDRVRCDEREIRERLRNARGLGRRG